MNKVVLGTSLGVVKQALHIIIVAFMLAFIIIGVRLASALLNGFNRRSLARLFPDVVKRSILRIRGLPWSARQSALNVRLDLCPLALWHRLVGIHGIHAVLDALDGWGTAFVVSSIVRQFISGFVDDERR